MWGWNSAYDGCAADEDEFVSKASRVEWRIQLLNQLKIAAIMIAAKDRNMTQPTMIVMRACAEM